MTVSVQAINKRIMLPTAEVLIVGLGGVGRARDAMSCEWNNDHVTTFREFGDVSEHTRALKMTPLTLRQLFVLLTKT